MKKQFKTYSDLINDAISKSQVYRGIRYYNVGEVYFCNEQDIKCQYPFDRVCCEMDQKEIEQYIDEHFDMLNNTKYCDIIIKLRKKADEIELLRNDLVKTLTDYLSFSKIEIKDTVDTMMYMDDQKDVCLSLKKEKYRKLINISDVDTDTLIHFANLV